MARLYRHLWHLVRLLTDIGTLLHEEERDTRTVRRCRAVCIGMRVDMCIDKCTDMCIDMRMDM